MIFRPRQAASECEGLAAHMASMARIRSGETYTFFIGQQRIYELRRDRLIRKYGIKCSRLLLQRECE